MKKIKTASKLVLNKKMITPLGREQINAIGGQPPKTRSCVSKTCPSTPENLATCQGQTCIFLDGCGSK